jgi:hypothetical protein
MDSVRAFLRLWFWLSAAILGYAVVDLWMHPWLHEEHSFSMKPDLARAPELVHWGGRLVREDQKSLLLSNAIVLGGALALTTQALRRRWRRRAQQEPQPELERVSILPPPP